MSKTIDVSEIYLWIDKNLERPMSTMCLERMLSVFALIEDTCTLTCTWNNVHFEWDRNDRKRNKWNYGN